MSVGSGVPYNAYTGNGLTTVFAYGFTLLDAADLVVTIGGVVTSAYTVSGVGVAAGGSITFSSAPANGATILLQRVIQLVRTTEYQSNGDLQAETVNDDFDRLWTAVQQVSDVQSRSIRAPIPESLTALPVAASRLGLLPVFNATTGDVELSTFTATQVASAVAAAYGAGATADASTYLPAGTGAVARTVQDKLRESVSVLDFGATGDGTTDDTAALQAAADHINSIGGGTVYLPQGNYIITAPISIYSNTRFIGAGGTATKITKTSNTPVAASATTNLVCLFLQPMGDGSGDVNCILWVTAAVRAEKVEIAHMTLRSNATSPVGSPVKFGIATVGMSDSHIHDLQIEYVSSAAFVAPTFWFSKIELVQTVKCLQGIAIENGTTCTVQNNYVVGAQTAGYYLRDMKYSQITGNACDDNNSPTAVADYSDRSVYGIAYKLDACYGISFTNNGAEQCYGTIWLLDSCQNVDVTNNVCISPRSDYTGADQVALFMVNVYARNVSIKRNLVFRNNVTALQGSAVSGQHSDVYVDVVSTNRGFEFANNIFCNTLYDSPSAIYGNNAPTYITTGVLGGQVFGEFTPTMSLSNATGVSITYGANNKGRYSIVNGWMFVEAYVHLGSVTFTGATNIYPQIGGLPIANGSAQQCDLAITQSSNVTWPSTEAFWFAIDAGQKTGLARNRTRTVTLGAGGSPSFASGSTDVIFKCAGSVYVGDLVNIV